ncbi:MAG: hypothetical protein CL840_19455 [Crocinitomicaceae bacterium]|nr:hypothetical protein [Crocinitomicaceae bacterium]
MRKFLSLVLVASISIVISKSTQAQYCTPTHSSTWDGITKVTSTGSAININKSTTASATHKNYTSTDSISTGPGRTINLSISHYRALAVWVDWNDDGDFTDTGEQMYRDVTNVGGGTTNLSFTVPVTTSTGSLRMRVMNGYYSPFLAPCGTSRSGESEDYRIYVDPPKTRDAEMAGIFPTNICPGSQDVNVKLTNRGIDSIASIIIKGNIGTTTFGPTTFTGLDVKYNKDTVLKLGTFNFSASSTYNMQFLSYTVNGASDQKTSNDTANYTGFKTSMGGTYTIGGTSPDFATFNAARTALYANGVCAPVTFNVRSGTYTERVDFQGAINGSSSTNTIRFRPDPANTASATLTFNSDYTIRFGGGVSYVAFDSLNLETSGFANVVEMNSANDNISFTGNTFKGLNTTSSSFSYAIVYDWTGLNNTTNFSFIGNTTNYGSMAVLLYGQSTSLATMQDGFTIKNNTVRNAGYFGFYLRYVKNGTVEGNDVRTRATGTATVTYGLYGYYNYFVDVVSNQFVAYASSYTRGLYWYRCYGTSSNRALFANNMFSSPNSSTSSNNYNYFYYDNYTDIVFNSFYGKRASTSTSGGMVYLIGGTSVVFRNNCLFNDAAGYALDLSGSHTKSYNNLYGGSGSRNVTGGTQGANGLNINPSYISATDLHTTSIPLYQKGTPFTGVTTDIDGETRHATTPTMGADEYVLVANDAGVQAVVLPTACPGTVTVKARIKNYGVQKLGTFAANWTVKTGSGSPVVQTPVSNTDTIAIAGDTLLTLGTFTVVKGSVYDINVYTSSPNGVTDQKTSNDTMGVTGYKSSMNGTYTIGGTTPDFATFNAALTALKADGICAPVVFNVRSGTYTEQVDFNTAITGSDSTNTIRFRPDPANTSAATLTFNNDYTIRFGGGVSYVAFDSLNLETSGFANVVEMNSNNDHISFTGNTFKGVNTTSSFNGYAIVYDWAGSNNTTNFSFIGNTTNMGSMAVYLYGQSTSVATNQDGFTIKNNTVRDAGYYGFYLRYVKNGIVEGNDIRTKTSSTAGITYGIYGYYNNFVDIIGNKIELYATSYTRGLYLYRCYGSSSNRALIANNMISSQTSGTSTAYYTYFYYDNYTDIINNSFYGKRATTSTNGGLVYLYSGTSVAFRNNSVFNDAAGYALDLIGSHTKSNNNLYGGGGSRNVTGGSQGANGKNVDPKYKSATDLHTESVDLYRSGIAFSGVTKDIDGDTRYTTPCIGADEYTIPGIDVAPTEVYFPPSCPGVVVLKARIENKGLDTLTSFTVNWSVAVNSGSAVTKSPVSWSGSLLPGQDTLITLGNQSMAVGSVYHVEARTSNPNATTDQRTINDTVRSSLRTALNGTYTVGGLTPDYTTIADAIADLNAKGICGVVVFDIRPGTYTGLMKMGEIAGASATNTITWKGSGVSNTTISYAGNNTNYATVELEGTDFMTFKNLKITNTYTGTYSTAIRLHDGANNITVDSCELSTSSNGTSYGLVASPQYYATTGAVNNNITVSNSVINNVGDGIHMRSNNSTNRSTNIRIENNTFTNIANTGIYVNWYFDSVQVINNNLSDFGGNTYGLYCYYVKNLTVDRNNIVAGGNYAMYLYRINYTGATSSNICRVTNNMVSQTGSNYAMYLYYANYADVYHNSARSESNFAMYDRFGTGKEIKNNIFYSGTNYAYYSGSTSTSYLTSLDNNVYYRGNGTLIAYHGGGRTLATWKTYRSSLNTNSVVGDPKFVAKDDLRIANGKPADSLGVTGTGVLKDIFDSTRSTTNPDAGAHEFDYQPIDGYLVGMSRPTGLCLTSSDTLEFEVVNVGGDTIQLGTNGVSIAWSVTGPNTASGTDAINVGTVPPGDTVRIKTANSTINLSTPGTYTVTAYITSSWDKYDENDTLVTTITRLKTDVLTAVKDTTVYYKDSLDVTVETDLGRADVVISEASQFNSGTGAPSGGRPSYMNQDDYVEISTAKPNIDLEGYRFERWRGTATNITYTFPSGVGTGPAGTLILGEGTGTSSPSNYYWTTGGIGNGTSSSTPAGYILKDPSGKIIDVTATNGYTFPAVAGVSATDWTGGSTGSSGSTHGIRRTSGPDNNGPSNWTVSNSGANRQTPNIFNPNMGLVSTSPPQFFWSYLGSFKDSSITTKAGPWTAKGIKDYIAQFKSPCTNNIIRDTATITAFQKNAVLSGNAPEYYSYPLSQASGIGFSGSVNNLGDSITNIRVYARLGGSAAGDSLASSALARFGTANYTINNGATVTTTGNKDITYYLSTTDDFPNDDTVKKMVNVSDTVMAREGGMLNENVTAAGFAEVAQKFEVFNNDTVTGAMVYVKTAFPGDKFKAVLYNLPGSTPSGAMLNETVEITLTSTSDTGWKYLRFKCLSVLNAGNYALSVKKTSTVFSSGLGGSKMNATIGTAFAHNGTNWIIVNLGGDAFNAGIRMVFGSYDYPTFAAVPPVCTSGAKFPLSGGAPGGGSYFGTGVSGDSLNPASLTVGSNTIYYTVANALGCSDTIASTVDVKAEPIVSSTFTQLTSCIVNNASISVTATNGFGTFSYSNNGGTSYQSSSSFPNLGSGSYTVMVKDSVCVVTDTTYTATPPGAPPKPTAAGGSTYCKGDTIAKLNVTSTGTGGTYKWYTDGSLTQLKDTGATISAFDSTTTLVYYVIEDKAGCTSAADTTSVTVNPLPTVTNTALSNRCTNVGSVVLNTGTPSGGVYTGSGVSGGSFYPDSAGAGTHSIKYTYTDGNNCKNSDSASVIIYQAPVVTLAVLDSQCTNTPKYNLTGGLPTGGTYSGFGVVSGQFDPNISGQGLHTVQYKVTNTNCADSASSNIRVHTSPVVKLSSIADRCLDAATLTLTGGTPTGGTYIGNGVAAGIFSPSGAGAGTHSIKYIYTDNNRCTDSASTNAHVDSLPVVTFTTLPAVCANTPRFAFTQASASPSGGTGTYFGTGVTSGIDFTASTAGSGTTAIGYAYVDGNGCRDSAYQNQRVDTVPVSGWSALNDLCIDAPPFTSAGGTPTGGVYKGPGTQSSGMYIADSAGVGTHTLYYVITDGNNCMDSTSQTQVVHALPVVKMTLAANWCLNAAPIKLTSGTPKGGTYTVNGVVDTVYKATVSKMDTVIYSYTDSNTCVNTATAAIKADTVPVVSFSAITSSCIGYRDFTLNQGAPVGGIYSGNNIRLGKIYMPKVVTVDTLTYTFVDSNMCADSAKQTMTVNALPVVTITAQADVCENAPTFAMTGGSPVGGTYSGGGVSGGNYTASTFGVGTDQITYVYTDANNCTDSNITPLVVHAVTKAGMHWLGYTCDNSVPTNLAPSGLPNGGVFSGTGVTGNDFDPTVAGVGTHNLKYVYTNGNSCQDSIRGDIIVEASPVFKIQYTDTVGCGKEGVKLWTNLPGMTYKWSDGDRTDTARVHRNGLIWVKVTNGTTQRLCSNSDSISVRYDAVCVGMDEALYGTSVRYFPNPNDGNFYYELEGFDGMDVDVTIQSMSGQVVYETSWSQISALHTGEIQVEVFESGVYFINLKTDRGNVMHRITINK